MHYHFTSSGDFRGHWEKAKVLYEQIMRDDERVNYLTVLRSPREHFLSYYYYFIQPEVSVSLRFVFFQDFDFFYDQVPGIFAPLRSATTWTTATFTKGLLLHHSHVYCR